MIIADTWTDELLQVMLSKLSERKQRTNDALAGKGRSAGKVHGEDALVSDTALFAQLGKKLTVNKRGD